jgi:acyl carrier protein
VTAISAEQVRQFLLARYATSIENLGFTPAELHDDFDFLVAGVIDSFGILEMIGAIEDEFGIRVDMAALDAEAISILGPLSNYVAQTARPV